MRNIDSDLFFSIATVIFLLVILYFGFVRNNTLIEECDAGKQSSCIRLMKG